MMATFGTLPGHRKTAIVAAALCVLSVFLPWASLLGISVSGISTDDGKVVLVVAGAALLVLASSTGLVSFLTVSRRTTNVVSAAAAALCAVVGLADMNEFAAIGLYLLLLASIAWVIAAVLSFRDRVLEPAANDEASSADTTAG